MPTFKEVGFGPMNRTGYYGPRGLPREVVDRVNAAVRKTLEDPSVKKRIEDLGAFVVGGTPEQLGEQIKAELAVFKQVVLQQKLSLD